MNDFALSELQRRVANLLRIGKISELDAAAARVRVTFGEITTDWLPWFTTRAGKDRTWWAPEVGEQVMLLAPSGELNQAVVLPAIYQSAYAAPGDRETLRVTQYDDGTKVEHDRTAKVTRTTHPDGTVLEYDATNSVLTATIKGAAVVTTDGNVSATIGGELNAAVTGSVAVTSGSTLLAEAASGATVKAPTITLDGNVVVTGNMTVAGTFGGTGEASFGSTVTAQGDVTGADVSLSEHIHSGIQSGPANTGPPVT